MRMDRETPSNSYGVALIMLALIACFTLWAHGAKAAEVEAFASVGHVSNVFRGRPFNDRPEFQSDSLLGGVTITAGKRGAWEIDLAHGWQRTDRVITEPASALAVRFYPGRLR
jgi:hypothetical protein